MESGEAKAANVGFRAGAAAVGAMLTATVGPEGGAAAAEVLTQGAEALVGWLDRRAKDRVTRTLAAVAERLQGQRERGAIVRDDLADSANGDAAALFEAVVAAAAQSAEDRKCEVIANVYASILTEPHISIDDALLYLRRIRGSSWRQLVALQYLLAGNRASERETKAAAGAEGDVKASPTVAAELVELAETLGLVGVGHPGGSVSAPTATMGGGGFTSELLARWTGTNLGRELALLGDLDSVVREDELDEFARRLAEPAVLEP